LTCLTLTGIHIALPGGWHDANHQHHHHHHPCHHHHYHRHHYHHHHHLYRHHHHPHLRYGKQSFGTYWEVFRDLEIKEEFVNPYKLSEAEKREARDDKFIEKDLFNLKIVYDFKMLRPKMTAFVLQSVTPVGEEKIKERCRAINEDDIIGMVKLIITCHTSTGKASLL